MMAIGRDSGRDIRVYLVGGAVRDALLGRAVSERDYVVVGATVVTYFLNLWAVKRVVATRVALYIFLQPVVAATLGVAVRGESLTPRFLVATGLVFVALSLRDGQPRPAR